MAQSRVVGGGAGVTAEVARKGAAASPFFWPLEVPSMASKSLVLAVEIPLSRLEVALRASHRGAALGDGPREP